MNSQGCDVYSVIRNRIANGQLGPGSRVSELGLSKELGVSRGLVREAVRRLSGERVLEHVPTAGTFVKKLTREELKELYQFRQWIEGGAAAEAAQRINDSQLAKLEGCCEEMRAAMEGLQESDSDVASDIVSQEAAAVDIAFHLTLMRASGNQRAVSFLRDQHILSRSWSTTLGRVDITSLITSFREHQDILAAVRNGDADLTRLRMVDHIAGGLERGLHRFDQREAGLEEASALAIMPEELERRLRQVEKREKGDEAAGSDDGGL